MPLDCLLLQHSSHFSWAVLSSGHKKPAGRLIKLKRTLTAATELGLELLDATCGVDETFLTRKGGVRIGGNIANNDLMLDAINGFGLAATHCGAGQEFRAGGNIHEGNGIQFWMDISFHRE
jgi:hypothetical protein